MKRVTIDELQNDFEHLLATITDENDKIAVDIAENRSVVMMPSEEYEHMTSALGIGEKKEDMN
jgi:hypothetical protein